MKKFFYNLGMIKRGIAVLYSIEKWYLLYLTVSSAITPVIPCVNIYMTALIVNELAGGRNPRKLVLFAGVSLLLNMLLSLLAALVNRLKDYHDSRFFRNERMYFSRKIMDMDYKDMENPDIFQLRETVSIQSQTGFNMYYLYTFFGQFVGNVFNIGSALVLVLPLFMNNAFSAPIKLVICGTIIAVMYINLYCNRKSNAITNAMYNEFVPHNMLFNFYSNYLGDYNAGKDIRLYSMENMLEEEQGRQNNITNTILVTARKNMLKFVLCGGVTRDILTAGVYLFVLHICLRGGVLPGDITKYAAGISLLVASFTALIVNAQNLVENNRYLKNYFEFLDIPRAEAESGGARRALPAAPELRLENVWFRYPNSKDYVLKNVSLTIKPGSRTAIVGENGSGKTTLIKLLCRLYEPEKGTIYLNGMDIRGYDKKSYMETLGVVFQDFILFAFPAGNNIAASGEYNAEKVLEAAEKAGCVPFFRELPRGLETPLYKDFDGDGVELSGGEAQKIALARAFYKNTRLFLLDEPTASLDPVAESGIYERINGVTRNAAVVFVSHRLSSCKFCDTIMVFDGGELIQTGTHDQMLSEGSGKYAELWNAQASFYQRDNP
ncbi:MAG: ABC transporter ATP-binding protein/permease [Treponema sp.]|jgi:ATP-binding cassette subfamily B protein|nr:ABC transporter ATP-binding protein/permease [Treponema sp.]